MQQQQITIKTVIGLSYSDPLLAPFIDRIMPTTDEEREAWKEEPAIAWLKMGLEYQTILYKVLELVAEISKSAKMRDIFGSAFIPPVAELLEYSSMNDPIFKQILRVIANLCYEHDANRELVDEYPHAIALIVSRLLKSSNDIKLMGCSAMFNLSMDNEKAQAEIVNAGGIPMLLGLLNRRLRIDLTPAALLLSNILESDDGIQGILSEGYFGLFLGIIKKNAESLCFEDEPLDGTEDVFECLCEALESLANRESIQRALLDSEHFSSVMDICELDFKWEAMQDSQGALARVLTMVSSLDEAMKLFMDGEFNVPRVLEWMSVQVPENRISIEKKMAASLIIGNLARSDDSCRSLESKYAVLENLKNIIEYEVKVYDSRPPEGLRDAVRVLHAATGAVKNLTVSTKERTRIAQDPQLVSHVCFLLSKEELEALFIVCLGILRNLTLTLNKQVYRKLIEATDGTGQSILSLMIQRIWKMKSEEQKAIRTETGRLIVSLIKALALNQGDIDLLGKLIQKGIVPVLLQLVTGASLTASLSDENLRDYANQVNYKADYLSGDPIYPIVQNEGLVSLVLLCQLKPDIANDIKKYHHPLLASLDVILDTRNTSYSDEIRVNAVLLIYHLISSDESFVQKCSVQLAACISELQKRVNAGSAQNADNSVIISQVIEKIKK